MSAIILEGFIQVPLEDLEAVVQALPVHIELTRQESECIVFEVTRDPADTTRFNVYEEFSSRIGFEHHQLRVKASHWAEVSKSAIRHYKVSEK